jgi:acyl-CoA reductase-like NAD-dependent aldehyde dehydrogenase
MAFVKPRRGSAAIPEVAGAMPPTSHESLDLAVEELAAHRDEWARLTVGDRLALLERIHDDCAGVVERWVSLSLAAKGITAGTRAEAEEWLGGPLFLLRNLRLLRRSLEEIARDGRPRIRGRVTTRPSGQVTARVFPADVYDRIFFRGFTGDVWMEPGVRLDGLPATQAQSYQGAPPEGKVALVLGAGNVSSIGPMDALYKLFVEKQVVVLKMNPVNAYLGPLIVEGLRALVARGFVHVVYGGAAEGAYLCGHPQVDEIHITGSDRTHDAIVFGTGQEAARRKAERRPFVTKRVTSELGNVSPVIVVPGTWREGDFRFHAANIAGQLVNNAGFNCNAVRVIVQHAGWDGRGRLLAAVREVLAKVPLRQAYYPGAAERCQAYLAMHPRAERFGAPRDGELPWVLASGLDPAATDDICFTQEAFCGVASETALEAADTVEFLERATAFANDTLWGTLNVGLIVHPSSLRDRRVAAAFDRAVEALRFGTVSVNHWAAAGYAFVTTPWGAFGGGDIFDVHSGIGEVHNTPMFSRVQKNVARGPFRVWPVPPWFPTCRTAHVVARRLTEFEMSPSPFKLLGILSAAVRG